MGRADSPLRDRVIFVVGARRSGTNWLQRVLTAHPEVAAVPTETYLFSRGLAPVAERFQHGSPGSVSLGTVYMAREPFLDALRDFCDAVLGGLLPALRPGATRICERTPEHATCLDLIGDVYPDARVVHIVRDGRDVARSLAAQTWGPGSLRAAAEEWRAHVSAARAAGARLAHYHEVRYEEMLDDPRSHVEKLFGFLGLDVCEPAVAEALREAAVPFNVDPHAPVVATGKWRTAFTADELSEVLEVAGPLLAELGYLADGPPGAGRPVAKATGAHQADRASRLALLAGRVRAAASGARRRVAGRRPATDVHRRIFEVQATADVIAAAVSSRDAEALTALLAPDALVRVVCDGRDRRARGSPGRELLQEVLTDDPALAGTLVRGDVHPALPACTVVARYRTPDGTLHDRVLVVTDEGGSVASLTWYQLAAASIGTRPPGADRTRGI